MAKNIVEKIEDEVIDSKAIKAAEKYWQELGPGLITGAADDDPSGIATYSQAGAQFGFKLLWMAPFSFPLMAIVQEMCARIGLVTGRGLAANIKHHYPKSVLYFVTALLFLTNSFNLGADFGAMAQATQLLAPWLNFSFLVIFFAVVILLMEVFISYKRYSVYLKYLTLVLFAYVISALMIRLNWGEVIRSTVIPTIEFSKQQIFLICAILGTTISPYLFFWQTSEEVEEEINAGKKTVWQRKLSATKAAIKKMRIDVWSGMFFSNMAMFFIIVACAGTLYVNGITNINSAAEAASALRPIAGDFTFLLFALGIIGTGLLAVPVLAASASYAVSECFDWRLGLFQKLRQAKGFYAMITLSILVGLAINFLGIDPIKALIYSAVANGIIAPFIIFFIVRISANKKTMAHHRNHLATTIFGWIIFGFMVLTGLATIWGLLT